MDVNHLVVGSQSQTRVPDRDHVAWVDVLSAFLTSTLIRHQFGWCPRRKAPRFRATAPGGLAVSVRDLYRPADSSYRAL